MMENAWLALVALSLLMYVTLDGYDLGMGMRLLFDRDPEHRREALEIVASAWDGNESWLVLLGLTLWTGFPVAYGAVLPYIYLPIVASVIGLILRGVSIELVSQNDPGATPGWMSLFIGGSYLAAFSQGVAFGALTEPVVLAGDTSLSGAFSFLTPYSVLTGVATMLLYSALGAAYVRMKTSGTSRRRAGAGGRVLTVFAAVVILVAAVSINATAAPLILDLPPRLLLFCLLAVLAAVAAAVAFIWFAKGSGADDDTTDRVPFVALVVAVISGFLALVVGRYPILLPPQLTLTAAAAPESVLKIALAGVGVVVPFLFYYTWFAHHEFRGRYVAPARSENQPDSVPTGTEEPQADQPHHGLFARILGRIGWVGLGALLYALCINMFSHYPQYHSGILTWAGIIALSLSGGYVWVRDELRFKDGDD